MALCMQSRCSYTAYSHVVHVICNYVCTTYVVCMCYVRDIYVMCNYVCDMRVIGV